MRLFGILLIFANLLAGVGFVFLATQDWKGRQSNSAALLRHVLLLQGLPLEPPAGAPEGIDEADDETPFAAEMGGGESTKTISKELLKSYFQANVPSAPAPPPAGVDPTTLPPKVSLVSGRGSVTNQVAEAKQVWGVIKADLDKKVAPDTAGEAEKVAIYVEKLSLLRGWLLYQAETYELRMQYLALLSLKDDAGQNKSSDKLKEDSDALRSILENRFRAVTEKPQSSASPAIDAPTDAEKLAKSAEWRAGITKDDSERRVRLAHLLVHLDTDAAWQKRVMVIVGMRRYVQALTAQTQRFIDMISAVERSLPDDQATFAKHESQLREKATQYQERARGVAGIRTAKVAEKTQQDDAVSRRQTQRDELIAHLNKLKAEVDDMLVKQTGLEKQLFELQREVSLTLEEVYRLDAMLAQIERERYPQPERP